MDDRREWMGRDIDNVEVYGSDIGVENNSNSGVDRHKAMLIGSAAVAAAAIASIILIRRKRERDMDMMGRDMDMLDVDDSDSEYGSGMETPAAHRRRSGSSTIRHLADKHLNRVSETFDDILDALVGAACGKVVSLIGDAVPSFKSEYDRTR